MKSSESPCVPGPGGPRTPEGKAISCLNNLKHGLTGAFRVLEFESQSDFDTAHEALIGEHAPATPTESQLIRRLAEHAWLSRRAQLLQDKALTEGDDKRFTLYMRYQTTNDRGFRACLNDLFRLRRERRAAVETLRIAKSGVGARSSTSSSRKRPRRPPRTRYRAAEQGRSPHSRLLRHPRRANKRTFQSRDALFQPHPGSKGRLLIRKTRRQIEARCYS